MPLSMLLNRPCTIRRRSDSTTTDGAGNEIAVYLNVKAVYELQQKPADDRETDDELARGEWVGFFPPQTALSSGDQVTDGLDGLTREVVGEPWHARNPRGRQESHVEATLARVAGSGDIA